VVVAEIFAIKPNAVDAFARAAETTFAGYRNAGVREAGVLVTLDAQNKFSTTSDSHRRSVPRLARYRQRRQETRDGIQPTSRPLIQNAFRY
jgi:hypothetical protein